MSEEPKAYKVRLTNSYSSISAAVIVAFGAFAFSGGWKRVDCSIGIQKACEAVQYEYDQRAPLDSPSPSG